jgi:flagellar biosynthesis protein FlhB
MIIKIIVVGLLIFMVYNLFKAMMIMLKNDPNQPSMSKFIGRRLMISVAIVLLLIIGLLTGVITPNPRPY